VINLPCLKIGLSTLEALLLPCQLLVVFPLDVAAYNAVARPDKYKETPSLGTENHPSPEPCLLHHI
jgi:hypothetical protein